MRSIAIRSISTKTPADQQDSQVIVPNTDTPTAEDKDKANKQVQTDAKPDETYRLRILYTIGGAPNKQLVQPYELTIDQEKFNSLGKDGNYEYVELPKVSGYAPSFYHTGNYSYYVKDENGDYVIDDGTHGTDAMRYIRLSKELIQGFATHKASPIGNKNGSEENATQNFGEMTISYVPKLAKYYVRHMVQDLNDNTKFHEAPGIGEAMEVIYADGSKERIHAVKVTGTVGSTVTAMALHIPGYEPENNVISSPLSDSEKDSDKLILNLRYYRKTYEVTYDTGGGSDVTAQRVYYEDTVPSVENPTWRGHKFLGWTIVDPSQKDNNGQGDELFEPSADIVPHGYKMPDHNVRFRALWEANKETSYRINVWVQKADLVDPDHPDSLVNYDFIDTVVRNKVATDSTVDVSKISDTGVLDESSGEINGTALGFPKEELQGEDDKGGLIRKFNWMNDKPIINFEKDDETQDNFTRYFHVNKKLTRQLNEQTRHLPGLGPRAKNRLAADDLQNVLNVVYDRKTYELIYASSSVLGEDEFNLDTANPAIYIKGKDGKIHVYCYNDGEGCAKKFEDPDYKWHADVVHKTAYRVKARFGQKLTPELFPRSNQLDFGESGNAFTGWMQQPSNADGDCVYLDVPPYRLTSKEFIAPSNRAEHATICDNPDGTCEAENAHAISDDQILLFPTIQETDGNNPTQTIIRKETIESARAGSTSDDKRTYLVDKDSNTKDDTSNQEYHGFKPPHIAGFTAVGETDGVGAEKLSEDEFYDEEHAGSSKLRAQFEIYKKADRKSVV